MAWLSHGVCELEARGEYVIRLGCAAHNTIPMPHIPTEEYVWVLCVTVRELEARGE